MHITKLLATNEEDFILQAADKISCYVQEVLSKRSGRFIYAFTGSNGERRRARVADLLCRLVNSDRIDWSRMVLILTDERFDYGEGKVDFNSKFVTDTVAKELQRKRGIQLTEDQYVLPDTSRTGWEDCAMDYERRLVDLFEAEGLQGPDLIVVGLGEDDSIGSIFPSWYKEKPEVWEAVKDSCIQVLCTEAPKEYYAEKERICLNLGAYVRAGQILVFLGSQDADELDTMIASYKELGLEEDELGDHIGMSTGSPKVMPVKSVGFHMKSIRSSRAVSISHGVVDSINPMHYLMARKDLNILQLQKGDRSHLTFTIMGAAGDLAKKKTFPALYNLFVSRAMPPNFDIIGVDNPDYAKGINTTDDLWEKRLKEYLKKENTASDADLAAFRKHIVFHPLKYDDVDTVMALNRKALELTKECESDNRVFYLALPSLLFKQAVGALSEHCTSNTGYTRYVVEKPFGTDLRTARLLANDLSGYIKEHQIYRIDHYLAKTMATNILTMRFANRELGRLFHADNVESVRITFKEDIECEGRAGYFDRYGIIRDIMQNHLLQLLTLVTMEAPASLSSEDVRDEKVKVLKQIRPVKPQHCVVGQYEGYLDEPDVPKDSKCPTFAVCAMFLDNERWSGVPFILKAGKSMDQRSTLIRLQFKSAPAGSLFGPQPQNELIFRVQPDESIYYKILAKAPGLKTHASEVWRTRLDLDLKKSFDIGRLPEAYEKLIHDVIEGESHSFVRGDEVEAGWKIFDPLLQHLESPQGPQPYVYPKKKPRPRGG